MEQKIAGFEGVTIYTEPYDPMISGLSFPLLDLRGIVNRNGRIYPRNPFNTWYNVLSIRERKKLGIIDHEWVNFDDPHTIPVRVDGKLIGYYRFDDMDPHLGHGNQTYSLDNWPPSSSALLYNPKFGL